MRVADTASRYRSVIYAQCDRRKSTRERYFFKSSGRLNMAAVARDIGVTQSILSRTLTGGTDPKRDFRDKLWKWTDHTDPVDFEDEFWNASPAPDEVWPVRWRLH